MLKINFIVDKKAEKRVATYFLTYRKTQPKKFDKYIKEFPELNKVKEMNDKEARKFMFKKIDEYYKIKKKELISVKSKIKSDWDKIDSAFYKRTTDLFDGHSWPKGKYTAVISIFNMFRLKPGTKVFSIPSEDTGGYPNADGYINYTTAHELMHIFVEDYYKKHFKGKLSKEKYYDLLEVVNFIALNHPKVFELIKWSTWPYPEHEIYCNWAKEVYPKCKNMKQFFDKAVDYLKV